MRQQPVTLQARPGATPISLEDATRLFGADAIAAGEKRGDVQTCSPWGIPISYTALATSATWKPGPTHDVAVIHVRSCKEVQP